MAEEERANKERLIGRDIADFQARWYGRGPSRVLTHVLPTMVIVVLEETFTPAERALIERGEPGGIQETRRRFQEVMADDFKAIVEQTTGQEVRAFLSNTDLQTNVSVETFLLSGALENMEAFEVEADKPGTEHP
jgi:uncharacterized protein YbcI